MKAYTKTEKLIRYCRDRFGQVIFLDSQMEGHPSSLKSYIAADPKAVMRVESGKVFFSEDSEISEQEADPWESLRNFRKRNPDWMFGYLGYDLKNATEDLRSENMVKGNFPDLFMMVPGFLIEISQDNGLKVLKGDLPDLDSDEEMQNPVNLGEVKHIAGGRYRAIIEHAQRQIREGDYYEINLSHVLEYGFEGDPLDLYMKMRNRGPVPFGSFMALGEKSICCMSPERFISKMGQQVTSQPIKGTIANNGGDDELAVRQSLLTEKNKAENLMIVDLVRNDLNRVSETGSVVVERLFEVQSFDTVHQMVSTIRSQKRADLDEIDVIKACFPMGSMTGAPKIAAMKAIEELEDYRRGVYSGAIGYMDPEGNFDFNVVIRTALIEGDRLYYPVGGAITSDSDPQDEWEETWIKARALTESI